MADTRLQAGAVLEVSYDDPPTEAETAEPSTVTVNYDKVSVTYTDVSGTSDTGTSYPVYQDNSGGTIQAMSLTDFKDTFIILMSLRVRERDFSCNPSIGFVPGHIPTIQWAP